MKPVVSIICNAYNHDDSIAMALDSFLMQETNFPFEVLVHDDASTDRTAEIIKEYELRYPGIIKPIYQKENQYSKDSGVIFRLQSERVKGKYVAICEGDDYWTDRHKLQKQYDAMEKHPEIDICAHTVTILNAMNGKKISKIMPSRKNKIFSVEEVILGGGGMVGTNSLFIRTDRYINSMEFRNKFRIDYTLQIQSSLRGGMLYLSDDMAVYRKFSKSSVTNVLGKNKDKLIKWNNRVIDTIKFFNIETNGKYEAITQKVILKREFENLKVENKYDEMFKHDYFKELSLLEKLKILIKKIIKYKN